MWFVKVKDTSICNKVVTYEYLVEHEHQSHPFHLGIEFSNT